MDLWNLWKEEVNYIMMNMHNNKTRKIVTAVIGVILVISMILPMVLSAFMS